MSKFFKKHYKLLIIVLILIIIAILGIFIYKEIFEVGVSNRLEGIEEHNISKKEIKKVTGKKIGKVQKLILYKDTKGYVKEVEVNGKRIKGEVFRQTFGLASSCFSLQKIDSVIEIQTKGIGHGFGFSQWEANSLAKEGKTYEDLLQYFYKNISIEKI